MLENPFQALKSAQRLPTPPGVALRILQIVQSEDASLEELTQVISTDPALVAKILKYIGSPVFGLGMAGATLPEAVSRIGMRGVQTLALSFSLISQEKRKSCPSFNFDQHWSKSLARAVAARQLAQLAGGWDPDEAFITGLVSTIGQLVFATALPTEYEPLLRGSSSSELTLAEREIKVLGTDHFTLGMALLKDWQLPEGVWQTTGTLSPAQTQTVPSRPAMLLKHADAIAGFLCEEGRQNFKFVSDLVDHAQIAFAIDPDAFRALLGRTSEEWMTFGRLLSVHTGQPPDLTAIEHEAEEQRTALRLAAEMEISNLRGENEQLSRIAHRDRLTGLHNRRAFDDALPVALNDACESGRPVALLLADIDHFKNVNDTHGHPIGDAVLRHVACVINDQARQREQTFRFGGEEFAVIAPDQTCGAALALADAMRAAVAATPFQGGGKTIPLTVSFGIAWAQWPDRPCDVALFVDQADQRLYDAKRSGRNQCCAEAPSTAAKWNPAAASPTTKGPSGFLGKLRRLIPAGGK